MLFIYCLVCYILLYNVINIRAKNENQSRPIKSRARLKKPPKKPQRYRILLFNVIVYYYSTLSYTSFDVIVY